MFAAVYPVFYAHFSEAEKGIKGLDVVAAAYDAVSTLRSDIHVQST